MFIEVTSAVDGNKILLPQYSNNLGVTVTDGETVIFVISSHDDGYWKVTESYEQVKQMLLTVSIQSSITNEATNGN